MTALCEWRGWLESLAGWFDAHPLDLADVADQRVLWERAARNLILHVVDRTGCDSGWYGHCDQVLTWFLSRWGVAPDVAQEMVDHAIGGRFKSWTGPDTVLVEDVVERLALSLRPADGARSTGTAPDRLQRWLEVRRAVPWQEVPDGGTQRPAAGSRDGAVEDIRAFDGAVDPARANGLLTAVELVRADAARGALLDLELLRGWQQHVLDTPQPPPFRTLPVFAKRGRERYGIGPDTRDHLDACLAESASGGRPLPVPARAARAYLDVCFFHPFDDGNARSAFLTPVFVLAREGITLNGVALLRRITFQADNPQDALALTRRAGARLDIVGALLATASIAFLIFGLSQGQQYGFTNAPALASLAVAVLLGVGFTVVQKRATDPMVPLQVLADPARRAALADDMRRCPPRGGGPAIGRAPD